MALLTEALYAAAAASRRVGEMIARSQGQTQARWQLMFVIADHALTVAQAARRLGVSRQNIQRVANDLERDGLIDYLPNPDHKTSPLVTLTTVGRSILERVNAAARSAHRAELSDFSPEEVHALRQQLQSLTASIHRYQQAQAQEIIDTSPNS
ncbi:MAG: MarR family transcriptional regulator [Microbacteriaceae bacterium]